MKGLGISEGIAVGKAFLYSTEDPEINNEIGLDTELEWHRFEKAHSVLKNKLKEKQENAHKNGDQERAEVFSAHEQILDDPEFIKAVKNKIETLSFSAEKATKEVLDVFIEMISIIEDVYLRQRAGDIKDIRNQIIRILIGETDVLDFNDDASIIMVGKEFNPSDIGLTEINAVKGFLAEKGAATTHFSILARISGVPFVCHIENLGTMVKNDDLLILDGQSGEVHINPSDEMLQRYLKLKKEEECFKDSLKKLVHEPSKTLDGHHVEVVGNIAGQSDAETLAESGAEGVGLFRTEFVYMDRQSAPTEDEQYVIYRSVLESMKGMPVVIRTMDVGGDKEVGYLGMEKEDNPFLGYRAIRYCLKEKEIFKTQIRAILRASHHGCGRIMLPMISTLEEVISAKAIIEVCKKELIQESIEIDEQIQVGIMIEVPSAVMISDILAKEVDFFSIGTNDLIQYTLAADRMNKDVAYLYHPYHLAFLRTLKVVIDNAHDNGIKVAMCGELASDLNYIPVLMGLGLDEFSMNKQSILKARWKINRTSKSEAEILVNQLLKMTSGAEIKEKIETFGASYGD